jgi:PAS domain S-box-containing protein
MLVMPVSTSMASLPLRLLLVEDQPLDAELVLAALERSGFKPEAICVDNRARFLEQLDQAAVDVVLCDYNLPSFGALEALNLLRDRDLDIPFIVISGSIGEETAVETIKRGADDYLLKDRLGRLGSAVAQALEQKNLRVAARRAEENLRQSEYKYRCLFEHLLDAAYLCDASNGRIIDTNRRGETVLGLERSAILGLRLSHFMPKPALERLLSSGTQSDDTIKVDTVIAGSEGRSFPVQVNATVVMIYERRLLFILLRETPLAPAA